MMGEARRELDEAMERPLRVGVVGCGNISGVYLANCRELAAVEVVACADLVPGRAAAAAEKHGVPRVCSVEELISAPEVEAVLNLTTPDAHHRVAMDALRAHKHVYNEKPLALTLEEADEILGAAGAGGTPVPPGDTGPKPVPPPEAGRRPAPLASSVGKTAPVGLRVGCAPDTFLGAGLRTCRRLIDDGAIGQPVAATGFMLCPGHESWHPDPEFYYKRGGGPLLDMGPYYLTALVALLGPVARVTGSARRTFPRRTITSEPLRGGEIDVEVPTHLAAVLDFASGPVGTLVTSFDVQASEAPRLEVYGSGGTLSVPDPNSFGGPVRLWRAGHGWEQMPLTYGYAENWRGIGLAEMAQAVRAGRPHRASGELARHVLEVMLAVETASAEGRHVRISRSCTRPEALPEDWRG